LELAAERQRLRSLEPQHAPITLTDDDEEDEDNHNQGANSEDDEPEFLREVSKDDLQSNSQLPPDCISFQPARCNAGSLRCGDRVELADGNFLHIVVIYRELATGAVFLKGNLMRRNHKAQGMLDTKLNELHYVLKTASDNQNPRLHECLVTRAIEDAICTREIIVTNQDFPQFSFRQDATRYRWSVEKQHDEAQLVCRMKYCEARSPNGKKIAVRGFMVRVSEGECDQGARVSDLQRIRIFLEKEPKRDIRTHKQRVQADDEDLEDIKTISPVEFERLKRKHDQTTSQDVIDLTDDGPGSDDCVEVMQKKITNTINRLNLEAKRPIKTPRATIRSAHETRTQSSIRDSFAASKIISDLSHVSKRRRRSSGHIFSTPSPQYAAPNLAPYTYADICAGAGGMASGAKQAGLKVQFLLDNWSIAHETLSHNFPEATVLLKDVHKFCISKRYWPWKRVDILHISYPCQPYSPLNQHDRDGGNNPENIATLCATRDLLQKCKPRIVTFEQTSGIVTNENGIFFHKLINDLVAEGYNVRWRVCNLAEYNNAQPRKRLVIIASCPGETLPTFPEPVNGLGPGKKEFVTVRKVLRALEPYKAGMPSTMRKFIKRNMPGYNSNRPLRGCITCDGGKSNLHPSGTRTFELCELAALQAFLPTHWFAGCKTAILKQIGNAVPSCFGKILFEHITKSLRETDRKLALWNPDNTIVTIN